MCRRDGKDKKIPIFYSKENSGVGVIHDKVNDYIVMNCSIRFSCSLCEITGSMRQLSSDIITERSKLWS